MRRRRRILLLAGAAVCLALATIAALTARDVGAWQTAAQTGDVEASASVSGTPSWAARELAPFHLARRLLGLDDDLAFRQAVELFRRADTHIPSFDMGIEGTSLRVQAEAELARAIRTDHNRARESAAANLLGALAVIDASTPGEGSTPLVRAVFEFQDAIHLDPTNDQAKANLELLYLLVPPPSPEHGSALRTGRSHSGASAVSPGSGY